MRPHDFLRTAALKRIMIVTLHHSYDSDHWPVSEGLGDLTDWGFGENCKAESGYNLSSDSL